MPHKSNNPNGRPPGVKSARASGTRTARKAPQIASRLNEKADVLEFLASVYQNPAMPIDTRIRAAQAFAPYRYPKLAAQHITIGSGGQSHAEWVKGITKAIRESDEPELKLINGDATEVLEDATVVKAEEENKGTK